MRRMSALPPPTHAVAQSLHFDARNASNESALLHSALRLGLLDRIVDAGDDGVDQGRVAHELGASPRGVRVLVEMLLGMKLAFRSGDRIRALPALSTPLGSAPVRLELEEAARWFGPAARLEQVVQTGEDLEGVLTRYRRVFLEQAPALDPAALELWRRFAVSGLRTAALRAASRLGLFEAAAASASSADIARDRQVSAEGLALLKSVLERMGVLAPGEPWRFSEGAAPIFDDRGRPYYVRSLEVSARYWDALTQLDRTVKTGEFVLDLKNAEVSAEFYADNSSQISAVFASHFRLARQAAATLASVHRPKNPEVLDIGTGSGVWGAAFAATYPDAQVTYFDQASVFPQVQANLERVKVHTRARMRPGNLFTETFEQGRYDIVILPQVLNVLVPEDVPGLIGRAARALKPTGVLVIAEYVLDPDRDGPLDHLYFQFRRYVTNEGDLFTFAEYAAMLREVGLPNSRCHPLPTQELILAAREDLPLPERLVQLPTPVARAG